MMTSPLLLSIVRSLKLARQLCTDRSFYRDLGTRWNPWKVHVLESIAPTFFFSNIEYCQGVADIIGLLSLSKACGRLVVTSAQQSNLLLKNAAEQWRLDMTQYELIYACNSRLQSCCVIRLLSISVFSLCSSCSRRTNVSTHRFVVTYASNNTDALVGKKNFENGHVCTTTAGNATSK